LEFYLKNDALGDPLLTPERLALLDLAQPEEVATLKASALAINQHLIAFFADCEITLVDFKLEFGRDSQGQILLADEISPDTCRLWDRGQRDPQARVLDKDRFRRDLGQVESAYQTVRERVLAQIAKLGL
jgi:phosphoribosylaminoimidazole-succinocarboxamide synthase